MKCIFDNIQNIARIFISIIFSFAFYLNSFAYDFEINGLYYNKLSNNTVECCGGGQSPTDATYRQREVTIPSKVRYGSTDYTVVKIAEGAWHNCTYIVFIQTLNLPETITEIGNYAFYDCSILKSINLPKRLESIGDGAFHGPQIEDYVFPKSLKSLGSRVFNRYLRNVIFTSTEAPTINLETFIYRNGSKGDAIPEDFCIYVPNVNNYSEFSDYLEYLHPICTFSDKEYTYNGIKPLIDYSIQLPENHSLIFDMKDVPIDAGSYDLVLSGLLDGQIAIEFPLHLSINKANLRIKIHNKSRQYGDENPEFTTEINGLQNNENINDVILGGFHTYTNATKFFDIGDYPILLSSKEAKNYNVTIESGKLSILKAPLSIIIGEYYREYGVANNNYTLNFQGLKNNETVPKWDKEPEFITEANIKTDVGTYPISVSCQPHNYEIVSVENGNQIITQAPLTLCVNSIEKLYYTENPDFTFSLSGLRNNDDANCLTQTPTFLCSATLKSDCGNYDIVPSDAESNNYNITYKPGTLTVIPQNLILIASNIVNEYGDPIPILKYDSYGLKGDDTLLSALVDEPILSTTAKETSNVGEYPITISGGTSKNYIIGYRRGTLTITKAKLTVIAEDAERVYGDHNPKFTCTYLGLKLIDTETTAFSSLPNIECTATKTSDVGQYTISVEGGTSHNYEVTTYQNGLLTITKSPLVLTANDKSKFYNEKNPQFDFILTGLKNNDTESCITTIPTYICTAEQTSDAGQYEIIPSNANAKNYTIEYQNGTLTVNPRPLTASVGNYTRKYNTENPSFDINYTGFVNGEDSSVLSDHATVCCTATKTSDVGKYTLTPIGGKAVNYVIAKYINGTLSIEKAEQTIFWDQSLSNIELYSQIALTATCDSDLPVTYEMSPNNVATLYSNAGIWYLDCYGTGTVNIRAIQNGDKNHLAAKMISKTLVINGVGIDPSNPQIYLHLETAGTLPKLIAENRKNQIKNLRLSGYLNGTDINYLREMAGCDSYGNTTTGILETLDITECTIISGGRSYYRSNQTSDYKISDYMFYNCKALVTLKLPNNSTILGSYALADCDRLSTLSIPNSVASFGSFAFRNDISLLRIPMPNGLTTIEDMAFYGCNGLTELNIPKNVTSLGNNILNACENISNINVESGNTCYTSKDGVLYTSSIDELLIFPVNHASNKYAVPNGVTRIASYAFNNAKKLTDITLPSTLTSIGIDAFLGCVNLNSLQVLTLTPPICQNDCFENVSKTRCELRVPTGCYNYYWIAPVWSEFNNIVEKDITNTIDNIITNDIKVFTRYGMIYVINVPKGEYVSIYQPNGTLIYQSQSEGKTLQLKPSEVDIVIVVIGDNTYKLLIK